MVAADGSKKPESQSESHGLLTKQGDNEAPAEQAGPYPSIWDLHPTKIQVTVMVAYLAVGSICAKWLEGWDLLTSLYVTIQVITTVGYGDITPQTEASQLFMSFYVFFGIAIIANIMNTIATSIMEWEEEHVRKELAEVEAQHLADAADARPKGPSPREKRLNNLFIAVGGWLFFLGIYIIFLATFEACSCSYDITSVDGCLTSNCAGTDGKTKTWVQAFYSGVITMTTVGFGDVTPVSKLGRILALVWMPFSVLATGNLVTALSNLMSAHTKHQKVSRITSRGILKGISTMSPDTVTSNEFLLFMLLRQHKVKQKEVDAIRAVFRAMDKERTGQVPIAKVAATFDSQPDQDNQDDDGDAPDDLDIQALTTPRSSAREVAQVATSTPRITSIS